MKYELYKLSILGCTSCKHSNNSINLSTGKFKASIIYSLDNSVTPNLIVIEYVLYNVLICEIFLFGLW